jgi:membrane protease YdiL (CAAX protease family)
LLIYSLVVVVFSVVVAMLGDRPDMDTERFSISWLMVGVMGLQVLGLAAAGWIVLRWVDRRPPGMLGTGLGLGWWRELLVGIAMGIGMVSLLVLVLVVSGSVTLAVSEDFSGDVAALIPSLLFFVVAAAAEELIFRGYPLQVLAEGTRPWIAGVFLCFLFAVGHLGNPDVTPVAVLNIFLIGILFTVTYFQTRRLWLPTGLHLAWNWWHSSVLGFDVSGIALESTVLKTSPVGHELVNGGAFGLEGSLLTTALVVVVTIVLVRTRLLRPVPAVAGMWQRYPAGFGLDPVAEVTAAPDPPAATPPAPDPESE